MKKIVLLSLVCVMCVMVAGLAFAQKKATQKEAIALADKAAAYLKANGEAKAFAEFNKKDGPFTDMSKDLYVFVFDMTGKCLSHGANPALIGRDLSGLKDSDGSFFIKEFTTTAKTKGSGWVDYNWSNPTTKKIEPKSTYILKVADNMLIGCGIYK
ncbi:MAG: histidine kinase [Syntrophus sp. (in: bacteria)]|nr:histidine kinase [Syntrophus sp. (in: bacteria)]